MYGFPLCKLCNQPIMGSWMTALGATWHPEHFLCAACGRPITDARFSTHQGAPYHIACYERTIVPHCVFCGRPLTGMYMTDRLGQLFCAEHEGDYPRCAFCNCLVPGGKPIPETGRVRCAACSASAIESSEVAKPIYREVIGWVSNQGLLYNNLRLSLEICGSESLARHLRSHAESHSLGATMSTTYTQANGQIISSEVRGVAVLLGLPEMLFRGVTIHELGHVWLVVQGVRNLSPQTEEGFCELLSYRYYQEQNTPESHYHAQGIEHNLDHTYGDGFRYVHALAQKYGLPRLLTDLQMAKRLPLL